ncbi:NAD-dependent epimerase/dehydratase family protein [Eubacteriales bacterium OttesenSCG-928-M02]|nr:NAD-dependent epimerase/dehydratase family protein [Eubacteriales bacterium OttesenSCG-928-M02]
MNILITGAQGFIGKNLVAQLRNQGYNQLLLYDVDSPETLLDEYAMKCDFVFHLAGVNRPLNEQEFISGNVTFTQKLIDSLQKYSNMAPIVVSSSIQADLDNAYGKSKKDGESVLLAHKQKMNANVMIYRLPNVYGKWSQPNYNSVIATFCYNIARDLPITINDRTAQLTLVYIDDVVAEFISALNGNPYQLDNDYYSVATTSTVSLGKIADMLYDFREQRINLHVPHMLDTFEKNLYSTYLSFLPSDKITYPLITHRDERGLFAEILKTPDQGQVSINVSKPKVTKGNHWHHTKVEKFIVVKGQATIRLRNLWKDEVIECQVDGDELKVVDILPGYTHSIVNTGEEDLITVIWANECFDPENADTYYLEV